MSAKSRKRNRRLAALAGLAGAVALANRKPKQSDVSSDNLKRPRIETDKKDTAKKDTAKKDTPTVKTSTTVMDSMPAKTPKNQDSIRSKNGKVFTIKGAKAGEKAKVSGIDTPGIAINDKGNITAGGKQYYDKNQYKTRNDKPGMLGDSGFTRKKSVLANPDINRMSDDVAFKKGGRVKGCGKALRGYGKAMKGNR